jgi:hypothetical protein
LEEVVASSSEMTSFHVCFRKQILMCTFHALAEEALSKRN